MDELYEETLFAMSKKNQRAKILNFVAYLAVVVVVVVATKHK